MDATEPLVCLVVLIIILIILLCYPYCLIMFILSLFGVVTPDGVYTMVSGVGTLLLGGILETIR